MYVFETDESLAAKVVEGSSSGRDEIYTILWNSFLDAPNLLIVLFGYGPDATVKIAGNFAHNDWLELLTCQGLLGIFCYIYYYYTYVKTVLRSKYLNIRHELVVILIIIFVTSIYSMSYMSYAAPIIICLGYAMSQVKQKNQVKYE